MSHDVLAAKVALFQHASSSVILPPWLCLHVIKACMCRSGCHYMHRLQPTQQADVAPTCAGNQEAIPVAKLQPHGTHTPPLHSHVQMLCAQSMRQAPRLSKNMLPHTSYSLRIHPEDMLRKLLGHMTSSCRKQASSQHSTPIDKRATKASHLAAHIISWRHTATETCAGMTQCAAVLCTRNDAVCRIHLSLVPAGAGTSTHGDSLCRTCARVKYHREHTPMSITAPLDLPSGVRVWFHHGLKQLQHKPRKACNVIQRCHCSSSECKHPVPASTSQNMAG